MLRYEPHTVFDAIEVGIAVFYSGVAKGVDGIQRHSLVYEKKFQSDSNDAGRIESGLKKRKGTKAEAGSEI